MANIVTWENHVGKMNRGITGRRPESAAQQLEAGAGEVVVYTIIWGRRWWAQMYREKQQKPSVLQGLQLG